MTPFFDREDIEGFEWAGEIGSEKIRGAGRTAPRLSAKLTLPQGFPPAAITLYAKKPDGVTIPRFLRLASDDLKSFYMEARMCQRPDQQNNDLQRWFWTETAMGTMLSDLAGRLAASEEQPYQQAAIGIAR